MCCYHPITVLDRYNKNISRQVPCGKCIGCLQDYQNSWKVRLTDELKHYNYKGVYCTLTYAPECAIETGLVDEFCKFTPWDIKHDRHRVLTVWKPHVQSWLKRSRRRAQYYLGKNLDFKYFITSEYGPQTFRPHYHCLFLGLDVKDFERFFLPDWSSRFIKKQLKSGKIKKVFNKHFLGNVDYEQIVFDNNKSPEACADYVSKYCSKGFFENPRVSREDVEPTFHLVSKGIGYSCIDEYKSMILNDYLECSMEITEDEFLSIIHDPFELGTHKDAYYALLSNYKEGIHERQPHVFLSGVKHYIDENGNKLGTYRNYIYCLAPSIYFMRELVERMFIVRTYDKKVVLPSGVVSKEKRIIKYKLPRYYYDKIFPQNSAIRKAVGDVLQILSDEKLSRQLASLSTQWPNETPSQIFHRYLVQTKNQSDRAESKAIQYVRKRYGKSIL